MAQPHYVVEYLGAMTLKAGQLYTTASIMSTYPTANMMKMKSEGIKVSIGGTDAFLISFDDESYITTGKTYIFSEQCTVVIGRYVSVT